MKSVFRFSGFVTFENRKFSRSFLPRKFSVLIYQVLCNFDNAFFKSQHVLYFLRKTFNYRILGMKSFHSHQLRPNLPWANSWENQSPNVSVSAFAFDASGSFLAVGQDNGVIELWDVRTIPVAMSRLLASEAVFTAYEDKPGAHRTISRRLKDDTQIHKSRREERNSIRLIQWSPDGRTVCAVISAIVPRTIRYFSNNYLWDKSYSPSVIHDFMVLWDVETGHEIGFARVPFTVVAMQFVPPLINTSDVKSHSSNDADSYDSKSRGCLLLTAHINTGGQSSGAPGENVLCCVNILDEWISELTQDVSINAATQSFIWGPSMTLDTYHVPSLHIQEHAFFEKIERVVDSLDECTDPVNTVCIESWLSAQGAYRDYSYAFMYIEGATTNQANVESPAKRQIMNNSVACHALYRNNAQGMGGLSYFAPSPFEVKPWVAISDSIKNISEVSRAISEQSLGEVLYERWHSRVQAALSGEIQTNASVQVSTTVSAFLFVPTRDCTTGHNLLVYMHRSPVDHLLELRWTSPMLRTNVTCVRKLVLPCSRFKQVWSNMHSMHFQERNSTLDRNYSCEAEGLSGETSSSEGERDASPCMLQGELVLVYGSGVRIVSCDKLLEFTKEIHISGVDDRPSLLRAGFVKTFVDPRTRHRANPTAVHAKTSKTSNAFMKSHKPEENQPSSFSMQSKLVHKQNEHWLCLAIGETASAVASGGYRLVFTRVDQIPALAADFGEHLDFVTKLFLIQTAKFPSRGPVSDVAISPSNARMLVALSCPWNNTSTNTNSPCFVLYRQRVLSDFPGAMYPIGFSLLQSCEVYVEAEDELDKVVASKEPLVASAAGTERSVTESIASSALLDVGCTFTHRRQLGPVERSTTNGPLRRLPFEAGQFELSLRQVNRNPMFANKPGQSDKVPLLLSKPSMVEAALLSYSSIWASKRGRTLDDRAVHVPLGLWGSVFDPTARSLSATTTETSNVAAQILSPNKIDGPEETALLNSPSLKANSSEVAASISLPPLPFTSFLRLPEKVASGEYRRSLGIRTVSALILQKIQSDQEITQLRMKQFRTEAFENGIAAAEKVRKSNFQRADKMKQQRLERLAEEAKLRELQQMEASRSDPAAQLGAGMLQQPTCTTTDTENAQMLLDNTLTTEETRDKGAMLATLQRLRQHEQQRAPLELNVISASVPFIDSKDAVSN